MRKFRTTLALCLAFFTASSVLLTATPSMAQSPSNDGRYVDLIRSYECRRDRKQYGSFYDYGYWKGGRWCGYRMPGGYYVYVDGVWYIWAAKSGVQGQSDSAVQSEAAAQTEGR